MADHVSKLNFRAGDPLRAQDLQLLADAVRNPLADVRGGPGLEVRRGARGQLQMAGLQPFRRYLGTANGHISPRSGTTPGTGTVTVRRYDGSALFSATVDLDVLNPSSNTMGGGHGIESGQYCSVWEDEDGWLWVSPEECS